MAEMVSLGKRLYFNADISHVYLSIWSTGTCGDTAEGMVGLRLRGRRGNYLPQPHYREISLGAHILGHSALPHPLLQAQLILLGNRKQSFTGSKRTVLETILAVKEGSSMFQINNKSMHVHHGDNLVITHQTLMQIPALISNKTYITICLHPVYHQ